MLTNWKTIRDLDASAVRYSVEQVEAATAADLDRPTPCAGWTLGDLLTHLVAQHRGFAAAAAGHGDDLQRWAAPSSGADALRDYRSAADEAVTAFAAVETPDSPFRLPEFGAPEPFPAVLAIGFHAVDYLVHAWDVAATLGRQLTPDDDLVEGLLPLVLAVPDDAERTKPGAAFAPAVPAPADASPLDRVLAALGRTPDWKPA